MMTMTCKKEHLSKNKNYCISLHLRRPIGSLDASNMVVVSFFYLKYLFIVIMLVVTSGSDL